MARAFRLASASSLRAGLAQAWAGSWGGVLDIGSLLSKSALALAAVLESAKVQVLVLLRMWW